MAITAKGIEQVDIQFFRQYFQHRVKYVVIVSAAAVAIIVIVTAGTCGIVAEHIVHVGAAVSHYCPRVKDVESLQASR